MNINGKVIYLFLLCFIFIVAGAEPNEKAPVSPESRPSDASCFSRVALCEATPRHDRRAVCGSDGITYPSICQFMKATCLGKNIEIARRSPCTERKSTCHIVHRYALEAQSSQAPTFVPRCRSDGSYAAVQCAPTGNLAGCWCVTPEGKPIPGTSIHNGRPDCTKPGKSQTKRRSSVRGQRNRRNCSRVDRSQFNQNLIKIFSGEYERGRTEPATALNPKNIAEWKFRELDRDRNAALQKSEYRGLRRLIKKVVKPKRCARAWTRGCDGNADGEITLSEWTSCLLPEPPLPDYDIGPDLEPDYTEEEAPTPDPSSVLPGIMRNSFAPDGSSDSDSRREEDANDCLTDRQAVLDEQKAGGAVLYVPECTGDGRYARAQCYITTGYCWCVHQDTGKPIPGSSVKDERPNCDAAPQHASPMRGCPEPMKSRFLRDLMTFFTTKMAASTNGTGPGEIVRWGASKEEQAATWAYVMLDKDKNKALERREWKAFHQLISNVETMRRCGRKLPRYCDVNHDNKISITEWMACLEVTQASVGHATETSKAPTNPRRKGPNPLESILKADD